MKTKFIQLTDTMTEMQCLVLQFEASDKWCQAGHFGSGLKVVLRFSGRFVTCFAGYELRDDACATIETLSAPMRSDGTIVTFKEILHFVDNIHILPDVLDVEQLRHDRNLLRHRQFISDEIRELLSTDETTFLRKALYMTGRTVHLALIDVRTNDVVFDMGNTHGDSVTAAFLWLPVDQATDAELAPVALCPLKYNRL